VRILELQDAYNVPLSQDFLGSVAWDNPAIQNIFKEIYTRTIPVLQKLVEQGQAEGAIHHSVTWEAIMAYTSAIASIKLRPDYLKTSDEYKNAISRLFYYGLIGK